MSDWFPSLAVLAAFTPAVLIVALTPGPDMTLFLGNALAQGRRAGIATLVGTNAGLVVHALFAAFGLSALLAASETAFSVVRFAGAAYLLWLAVQAIRHGSSLTLQTAGRPAKRTHDIVLTAFGVNLLNPKIVLFFVTFLPQFVSPADPHAAHKLLFLGLYFIAVSLPLCIGLVLAADRISAGLKRSRKAMRAFDYLFAGIMGAFAVRLIAARATNG
ncbi:LysE family translocator [Microbaculum sp. FT89]|uniref:LysE family translocator n=1 Tax=Microbaculum sp. FT89 TaxID=3447298 RepID=UPI003F533789